MERILNMSDFKLQTVIFSVFFSISVSMERIICNTLCWETWAQNAKIYFFKKRKNQLATSSQMVTEYPDLEIKDITQKC